MSQNVAYYSSVTEYESGWGFRSDGYIVTLSKDVFDAFKGRINAQNGNEFSRVDGPAKLCLITDEMNEKIKASEHQYIWTGNLTDWKIEG